MRSPVSRAPKSWLGLPHLSGSGPGKKVVGPPKLPDSGFGQHQAACSGLSRVTEGQIGLVRGREATRFAMLNLNEVALSPGWQWIPKPHGGPRPLSGTRRGHPVFTYITVKSTEKARLISLKEPRATEYLAPSRLFEYNPSVMLLAQAQLPSRNRPHSATCLGGIG